jgi:ABC-type phosphate transport system permease subunit
MAKVETPEGMRRRGWAAIVASVVVIGIMAWLWAFLGGALARHQLVPNDSTTAAFLGRLFVALTLVTICGVLGVVNGYWMIHYGRRNRFLGFTTIVIFFAAIATVAITGWPK